MYCLSFSIMFSSPTHNPLLNPGVYAFLCNYERHLWENHYLSEIITNTKQVEDRQGKAKLNNKLLQHKSLNSSASQTDTIRQCEDISLFLSECKSNSFYVFLNTVFLWCWKTVISF